MNCAHGNSRNVEVRCGRGDELLVKQLVRGVGNKIVVNSFNPSHPTQVVDPEVLPVQIFGQVVEYSCVLV